MLADLGIRTIRDGLRWHLIDGGRAHPFDWTSFKPMLEAAEEAGVEVLWDLLHFGWPDHVDVFSADFSEALRRVLGGSRRADQGRDRRRPTVTPVNEISFLSWGGGDHALFNPMTKGRGDELKRQLASASIAAIEAVWSVDRESASRTRIPRSAWCRSPASRGRSSWRRSAARRSFQAWDMISGRLRPELGGKPKYLDIIGVNYYCHNQWLVDAPPLEWEVPQEGYTPSPRHLFARIHERYGRPMYISETGIEAELRPKWFDYICTEVHEAMKAGVPIHGICLYPVMNHPAGSTTGTARTGSSITIRRRCAAGPTSRCCGAAPPAGALRADAGSGADGGRLSRRGRGNQSLAGAFLCCPDATRPAFRSSR